MTKIGFTSGLPVTGPEPAKKAPAEGIIVYMASQLPLNLEAAETEFRGFLAKNQYPAEVKWISIANVVLGGSDKCYVHRKSAGSRPKAVLKYREGLEKKLGIELRAICADEIQTFACIVVPHDSTDAQYRMIGRGLKMSCPDHRVHGVEISSSVQWNALRFANRKRNRILQQA